MAIVLTELMSTRPIADTECKFFLLIGQNYFCTENIKLLWTVQGDVQGDVLENI